MASSSTVVGCRNIPPSPPRPSPPWSSGREAGLPHIRLHDVRHTAVMLLLGRGVNLKVVSEMLGHASVRNTLDTYCRVLLTVQQSAVAEMDAALTNAVRV
ncbi:MAG: tyrosine-type recombinase/integrase [Ktedonobacterales bacterium]